MNEKNTFKTKTGFCHVLPDKIVLSRDGVVGTAAKMVTGNGISPLLFLYGALGLGLLYLAFNSFRYNLQFQAIIFFAVAVFLIFEVITSINNSTAPIINKKQIQRVAFKKGIPWITRSRFEVFFKNKEGKIKKRLILLPASLKQGRAETEKAIGLLQKAGLLPDHK